MSLINEHGIEKKISIVVPTLNEAPNIKEVFTKIPKFVDEIIVIDGHSMDGTREEIKKYYNEARIFIEKPSGKGNAIKSGFEKVTGDLVVMMDADGSHNPGEIKRLLQPVLNGHDVANGSRLLPGGGSSDFTAFRKMGNKIFVSLVNNIYNTNYTDLCYGYRAFKKEAFNKMCCTSSGFEIETEQSIKMKKAGLKVTEVPSFEEKRKNGNSNLNSFRDGFRILNTIIKEYLKSRS